MPNLTITEGLQGSGKTTWARDRVKAEGNTLRINRDDLRKMGFDGIWTGKRERLIVELEEELAVRTLKAGYNVIIDDTNLNPNVQKLWKTVAKDAGAVFHTHKMDTPLTDCIRNDRGRQVGRVGRAVIENTALKYGLIKFEKPFAIFDIDGTLANLDHRLSHVKGETKDWYNFYARVQMDGSYPVVVRWLNACLQDPDMEVVVVSGRPTHFKDLTVGIWTEEWMRTSMIRCHHLFMRQAHDSRPDTEVKNDILTLLPKDKILFAVDDRKTVCDQVWRANGIKTYQIAEGNF